MNTIGEKRKRCPKCGLIKNKDKFHKDKRNSDGLSAYCKVCRIKHSLADQKQKRIILKKELFEAMGGKCNRCGFSDFRALQIDHVYGGGGKEVRGNLTYYKKVLESYQKNEGRYQLLCANCNWIKRFNQREGHFLNHTKVTNN